MNYYNEELENSKVKKEKQIDKVTELCEKLYFGLIDLSYIKKNFKKLWFGSSRNYFINAWYDFLKDMAKAPKWRYNMLICGEGGTGKTTLADILSKILTNEEPFQFTDINSGFLGYYEQKAIIWDEMRVRRIKEWGIDKFLKAMNNGNKNRFYLNIKYGNVLLLNNYNFITTSQDPWKFLEGLTDRYYIQETHELTDSENSNQITRRFLNFLWIKNVESIDENAKLKRNTNIEWWKFKSNNHEKWEDKYELKERFVIDDTNNFNFLEKMVPSILKISEEIKEESKILEETAKKWDEIEKKSFNFGIETSKDDEEVRIKRSILNELIEKSTK